MSVTFDFLIYKLNTLLTLYSGNKPLGLTIQGKNENRGTIIVSEWDERNQHMVDRTVELPEGTFSESTMIQIRSDKGPTGTALNITVNNLVSDPNDYEHEWYISDGQPFNLPPLATDRFILIEGPFVSQDKRSPRPKPIESVMVYLEEGGQVVEPLVAGSHILTHGKWFELSPNNMGKTGESRGKYFLFLDNR